MKFILTGCTGFIGSEVLSQCLRNPTITSVVALSRRKLPDSVANDPKLKLVIMKDFNLYSESALKEISGADACIWYLFPSSSLLSYQKSHWLMLSGAWVLPPETKFWKSITHWHSAIRSHRRPRRSFVTSILVERRQKGIRRSLYGSKRTCGR